MTHLKNAFQFRSSHFPATEEERDEKSDAFINPGVWAKALSDYLVHELHKHGWRVQDVHVEDWGHMIKLNLQSDEGEGEEVEVQCANIDEDEHLVIGHPDVAWFKRWFKKIDVSAKATKIGDDLEQILSSDSRIEKLRRDLNRNLPE